MHKPFRAIALTAVVVMSAMSNAEAWSFGTQMRSPGGDYRGYGVRPQPSGSGGGFSFGYSTGGFDSCSQPYGGFYSHCRYGGSSFGPSANYYVPPPTYRYSPYAPGFFYEDGYYRGYYDGHRNRHGRRHQKFRSR
jgi:hypothetical protein